MKGQTIFNQNSELKKNDLNVVLNLIDYYIYYKVSGFYFDLFYWCEN